MTNNNNQENYKKLKTDMTVAVCSVQENLKKKLKTEMTKRFQTRSLQEREVFICDL